MSRRGGGLPAALALPALLGALLLLVPVLALVVRAPWGHLSNALSGSGIGAALRLSLVTASLATLASVVLGVPLAWLLARVEFPGRRLLRALVTVPLVLPPVVGGVALLLAFGRTGIVGGWVYRQTGYQLPFTSAAVVVAETFVAMPFLVVSVEGALRALGTGLDEAAETLGASRWYTFRRVTAPLVAPGVGAGAVLCWARALGEFGATVTFAGSLSGTTQTVPLAVYQVLQDDPASAVALSLLLLLVSVSVLVGLRTRWLPGG